MRYQHFGLAYPRNPVQLHGKRDTKCTQEELLFWIWNGLMAERNVLVISNGIHDRKSPTRVLLTAALGNVTVTLLRFGPLSKPVYQFPWLDTTDM